jgi:hypothetical protein
MNTTEPLTPPHGPGATEAFAVLVAFVDLWVVAAVVLATLARIVATPCRLLRGLHRRHRRSHAIAVPGVHVASLESPRVVA